MIFVALVIHPHEEGEKEVIVNVSNFDQSVNMNYLLRLRFTRQYKEQEKSVEEIVHRRYWQQMIFTKMVFIFSSSNILKSQIFININFLLILNIFY